MAAQIINGKEVSARIKGELKNQVAELKEKGINPGLAVVIVGDDPPSSCCLHILWKPGYRRR